MKFRVILKNLEDGNFIVLTTGLPLQASAEDYRKRWRAILGGKRWTVDRRPGLDTLDHLGLTVECYHH